MTLHYSLDHTDTAVCSVWKPLVGPLNDWPLAVCDVTTVKEQRDFEDTDLLYEDLATENRQVYYCDDYKWYYLSEHQVDELMVFKQSDSDPDACPGTSSLTSLHSMKVLSQL